MISGGEPDDLDLVGVWESGDGCNDVFCRAGVIEIES
jgi:hypothetical protein